ncbi:uncharacterized protein LOC123916718 [Trifolium pratense]|nr:uncharacterized protein LOC123916718 [Trifolium pratense]
MSQTKTKKLFVVPRMKTKYFILSCFYALLLISVVAIDHSKVGKTEESKTNIRIDCYAYWPSRGAIWKGMEKGGNGWCGSGKMDAPTWRDNQHWGTEWRNGGGKNRGTKGRGVGYVQPIPSTGKGASGGVVLPIPGSGKEGGN